MAHLPEENRVCRCFDVPEDRIRRAIVEGNLRSVEEVTEATGAGGGCGSCWDEIQKILEEIRRSAAGAAASAPPATRPPHSRPEP